MLAVSHSCFRILASTVDESIGRTYDKVARMLKMPWGTRGPAAALEVFCQQEIGDSDVPEIRPFSIPVPGELAFSFSGLHSAVERHIFRAKTPLTEDHRRALGRAFQDGAARQLCNKLVLCHSMLRREGIDVQHIVASGGVASNLFLRARFSCLFSPGTFTNSEVIDLEMCWTNIALSEEYRSFIPHSSFAQVSCSLRPLVWMQTSVLDNAAMIGWASMHRFLAEDYDDYSVELRSKWSIETLADIASHPSV